MAKVNMDLAELKQLENKIAQLAQEKQELLDKQHQVVVYHKYFNGRIKTGSFPKGNIHKVDSVHITGQRIYHTAEGASLAYFHNDIPLQEALDVGLVEIDITEDSSRHTKDYINMSEAVSNIREEEKNKVNQELKEALNRATNAEHKISIIEDKYKKKILDISEKHTDEIIKLTEKFNKEQESLNNAHDALQQKFNDYKEDKKRLSLEEELQELKNTLNQYKQKTFWQRVFNK